MAFEYFVQQKIEIAIVEVGLGGRLDSTNIITPVLSIITNIGWDHMNMLGNSLEEIAAEKAGIIKNNVPVIIGERQPATMKVFEEHAAGKNAPLHFASDNFEASNYKWIPGKIEIEIQDGRAGKAGIWETDLQGIYQGKNISTVLEVCSNLPQVLGKNFVLTDAEISRGLGNVKALTGLRGRWEIIHQEPAVVLEVAHNPDGIRQMLLHLQKIQFGQLHVVIGMVKDKDIDEVLRLLPLDAKYYYTHANIPRALDAFMLQEKAKAFGLDGKTYEDVNLALVEAVATAGKNDLIVVCGSIFLVAEVNRESITQLP